MLLPSTLNSSMLTQLLSDSGMLVSRLYLSHKPLCLSVSLSLCLSVYLSVGLSICLSACLSVCLSVCVSVYRSVCLSVCLYVCLPVCLMSGHRHIQWSSSFSCTCGYHARLSLLVYTGFCHHIQHDSPHDSPAWLTSFTSWLTRMTHLKPNLVSADRLPMESGMSSSSLCCKSSEFNWTHWPISTQHHHSTHWPDPFIHARYHHSTHWPDLFLSAIEALLWRYAI